MAQAASVLLSGFVHLVLSQVCTRLITFALNLLNARLLTPEAYGLLAVQFHLINTTILFLSREGFRRGCLRIKQDEPRSAARTLATAGLCLPLGTAVTAGVCAASLHFQDPAAKDAGVLRQAVLLQGFAAFLELCSEPLYILATTQLKFRLRVAAEAAAAVARGGLTLWLLRAGSVHPATALTLGQMAYAAVLLGVYGGNYMPAPGRLGRTPGTAASTWIRKTAEGQRHGAQQVHQQTAFVPKPIPAQQPSTRLLDRGTLGVCATFTVQAGHRQMLARDSKPGAYRDGLYLVTSNLSWISAGEKLLLAEGSKLVMATFETSRAQGVYGLVTNLGSLVVRTLFQPIEEAAFLSFSKSGEGQSDPQKARQQGLQILMLVLRCVMLVGLVATAFGPSYAYLLLRLLYGRRWSDTEAPAALGWYCPYIALLAVNGITEAYLHATAQGRELTLANAWLIVCSLLHMALSVTLVKSLGTIGLIIADSANMLLRILYSAWFIQKRAARQQLLEWAPHRSTMVLLAAAAFVAGASNKAFMATHQESSTSTSWAMPAMSWVPDLATGSFGRDALLHIATGVGCTAVIVGAMFTSEQALLTNLRQLKRGSHAKAQ